MTITASEREALELFCAQIHDLMKLHGPGTRYDILAEGLTIVDRLAQRAAKPSEREVLGIISRAISRYAPEQMVIENFRCDVLRTLLDLAERAAGVAGANAIPVPAEPSYFASFLLDSDQKEWIVSVPKGWKLVPDKPVAWRYLTSHGWVVTKTKTRSSSEPLYAAPDAGEESKPALGIDADGSGTVFGIK